MKYGHAAGPLGSYLSNRHPLYETNLGFDFKEHGKGLSEFLFTGKF